MPVHITGNNSTINKLTLSMPSHSQISLFHDYDIQVSVHNWIQIQLHRSPAGLHWQSMCTTVFNGG